MFAANRTFALTKLRVIDRLIDLGWQVVGAARADAHADVLRRKGVLVEEVDFARGGFKPVNDLAAYRRLKRLYERLRPRLIQHVAGKPSMLGSAAAAGLDAVVVNLITGLGHPYVVGGWQEGLANLGFRATLGRASMTVFENPDDRDAFLRRNLVSPEKSVQLVASGVDTRRCRPDAQANHRSCSVLMPARLIGEKGVREYIEAAVICKRRFPEAHFQLAGEFDPQHPDAISEDWIRRHAEAGTIEFLGYLNNLHEVLPACGLVVLPSYREGTPRVLLEAAACGVAVVATDVPGCREAVVPGETGLLAPPRDAPKLAEAISRLLADHELRAAMGQAGRQFAEHEFDEQIVADRYIALYQRLGIGLGQAVPQAA